ncbi:MAG: DUF2993 domain-containing protein [Actinomycetota bacterium]|nr:DUF2993 domain-containing protein [Actinomycetota bacterium]
MRRLVVTLVVLLGLLVAADFGAAAFFEHEVSKRAQQQFGLKDHPSVKVGGFSFLVQAISGEYESVNVDAKGVPVRDVLRDVDVEADLYGVQAPLSDLVSGSIKGVPVREVSGQVKIKAVDVNRAIQTGDNAAVRAITNLTIDPVSEQVVGTASADGTEVEATPEVADQAGSTAGVKLCGEADIAGQSVKLCVFSIISLVEGKVVIDSRRLELRNGITATPLPEAFEQKILETFDIPPLDPGKLPFEVVPTSVEVQQGLLSVRGTATNVVLGQSG